MREFPEDCDSILIIMESKYRVISKDTKFYKTSTNPLDKRLDLMAYFLSTIQTLQEMQIDFQRIKNICIVIASEYVRPKNRLQAWFKKLLPNLINTKLSAVFLKALDKKINKKGHVDGFLAKVITNKKETYGFGYGIDILECGICKLFSKHNAGEFSPVLCEVDKITSGFAGLELIREGTIANGAEKCDFRFKKK